MEEAKNGFAVFARVTVVTVTLCKRPQVAYPPFRNLLMLFDRQAIKPAYQKDQEPREDMGEVFSEEYSQLYKVLSLLTIHYSLFPCL